MEVGPTVALALATGIVGCTELLAGATEEEEDEEDRDLADD